jgi:hypothetical protein
VNALLSPCGGPRDFALADSATAAAIARGSAGRSRVGGAAMNALAPSAALRDSISETSHATPWLLATGAALLFGELALRRAKVRST